MSLIITFPRSDSCSCHKKFIQLYREMCLRQLVWKRNGSWESPICNFKHLWPTGILNVVKWVNRNIVTVGYSLHEKENNITIKHLFSQEEIIITMHICKYSILTLSHNILIGTKQGRYSINCLWIQRHSLYAHYQAQKYTLYIDSINIILYI